MNLVDDYWGCWLRFETRNPKLVYIDCMQLFINGDERTFDGPLTLSALIEHLGMKGDRVAVELNREIVARAQWAATQLNDGDRLEIVHFVGGGSTHSCCIPVLLYPGGSTGL